MDYHIPPDCITHSYRVYSKLGHSHVVEADPLVEPLGALAQLEQFQALLQAEKECIAVRFASPCSAVPVLAQGTVLQCVRVVCVWRSHL